MASDGILSIGATVDKTGVDSGLAGIQEGVQTSVQSIAVQVEETCARTLSAWNKLSDDVKSTAQSVSDVWVKAAEDSRRLAAAQADVRRATVLVKDATLDASVTTAALAAAQQRAAEAAAAASASMAAAKAEVVAAAEEEALSANWIVAGFQRAAISVRESMSEVQEKLIETAETGKLTAEGMSAGFSGMGKLLGAGVAIGFASHFLDETSKVVVELDHLHEKTGIATQDLAGLQQIVMEAGAEWDPIATGLIKMNKALADSGEPSRQLTSALGGVNLRIADLKGLQPEEQLQKISVAFASTRNSGNLAAAAIALFGRGGAALIPVLVTQGAALEANIQATGKLTGISKEASDAAMAWQQTTARLTAQFRSIMVPTIGIVEQAIAKLAAAVEMLAAYTYGLLDALVPLGKNLASVGRVIYDAMTDNFGRMKEDTQELTGDLSRAWEEYGQRVAGHLRDANARWNWRPSAPAERPESVPDLSEGGLSGSGGSNERSGRAHNASTQTGASGPAPVPQTQSSELTAASDEYITGLQAEVKASQDAAKAQEQAYREASEEKILTAEQDYREVERQTAFEVQMGRMSPEQRLAALRDASAKEQQIREQQSTFLQMIDMNDQKRYERDIRQQVQLARQSAEQIQQINQQRSLEIAKIQQQTFDRMSQTFSQNTAKWISGQESLSKAWSRTFVSMTQTVVENLLQQSIAYLTNAVTQQTIDERLKLSAAKTAAANTYKSVSGIPIVGPFIAPAAAAGAFAAVEAFDLGGVVGNRMGLSGMGAHVPILAEAGERVLTPSQSSNFDRLVNQTNSSNATHITFEDHSSFSGIDGASVAGMARQHGQTWRRETIRQLRLANKI